MKQMIWIRKANEDKWIAEPQKGELVNSLLARHFNGDQLLETKLLLVAKDRVFKTNFKDKKSNK